MLERKRKISVTDKMHVLRIYVSLSINLKTMKLSTYKVYNNPYETFLPKMLNLNQIKPFKLKYAQSDTICKKISKTYKLYYVYGFPHMYSKYINMHCSNNINNKMVVNLRRKKRQIGGEWTRGYNCISNFYILSRCCFL